MRDREYNPNDIEQKWYSSWVDKGYFHADENDDSKQPYTIVIPPRTSPASSTWGMH